MNLEERLAAVGALRWASEAEAKAGLRAALSSKGALSPKAALIVERAADLTAELEFEALEDAVAAAFDRFIDAPAKKDPNCRAKTALAKALLRLRTSRDDLLIRGTKVVQMEPGWGGAEDSAAELRGTCVIALANMRHLEASQVAAGLLADKEAGARAGAAAALGVVPSFEATPLLRYKALVGDDDNRVTAEVLGALLSADPEGSVPFVESLLDRDTVTSDAALIALGESRRDDALDSLLRFTERVHDNQRRVAYVSIAIVRSPRALDHLFAQIISGPMEHAVVAVEALGTYRHDAGLRERVAQSVDQRGDRDLARMFREAFQA